MRVPSFYSLYWGLAIESLWHDNNECEIGQSIPLIDRIAGTNEGAKHCQYCALLNQPFRSASSNVYRDFAHLPC